MDYYIGIDGGGTSTVGCLGTADQVIKKAVYGSSNYKGSGLAVATESIQLLLKDLVKDIDITSLKAICFGGAGVDSEEDKEVFLKIINDCLEVKKVIVVNDAKSGLVGAVDGFEGAVVISGTGSILYGMDKDGKDYRVGGWGHVLGDEGSGYTIGKKALSELSKYYDGRIGYSELIEALRTRYPVTCKESLINFVYDDNTTKTTIASVARSVLNVYKEDPLAKEIVDQEINLLVEQVIQLQKNMKGPSMKLATIGSLITKNEDYRNTFIECLGRKSKTIEVIDAIHTPELGALKIAIHSDL